MIALVVIAAFAIGSGILALKVIEYKGWHRGYSFVSFLLGLLFGPLGVAIIWMIPPNEEVVWARRAYWERTNGRAP